MNMFKRPRHESRHDGDCGKRFAFGDRHEPGREGHGGRGRGGFGRPGPGGRLRRLLEHGDLRVLVLHLIAEKPRHGYEIIKAIEDLAGGSYAPSPGVVYPTLTMLEDLGHVTSITEGNRKSFTVTPEGMAALATERPAVEAILGRIAQAQAHEPALPVVRAMENLKTALRLKLGAGTMPPDAVRKIADAIDQAARTIEDV